MDHIDDINIEVDGGYGDNGKGTKAFLKLTGDFVTTCEEYLADTSKSDITLEITQVDAQDLYNQLGRIVYGG